MSTPRQPVFVNRRLYRYRRIMDAARMLPVLGAVLVVLPMLWGAADGSGNPTASDGIYLFAVWGGLILAARLLSPGLDAAGSIAPGDGGAEDG